MNNKFLNYFSLTIAVIGAVNWGLIGFFDLNLVSLLFGSMSWISRIIYGLVGLCGLYLLSFYGLVDREKQEVSLTHQKKRTIQLLFLNHQLQIFRIPV